jgi:DNA-nicking Smr family endonuclease
VNPKRLHPARTHPAPRSTGAKSPPEKTREDPLFRSSVADVAPLAPRNKASLPKARPKPVTRVRSHSADESDALSDHVPVSREAGEPLRFSRPGVQRQLLRQLRRGGAAVEDELDLHGLTVAAARPLLVAFLNACARSGKRRVRIIHGKGLRSASGEGVLKGMVASWLVQRHDVLAYHEARAAEGGSGAVIVLLRGMRDDPRDR